MGEIVSSGEESIQWVERVFSGWRECPLGGESVHWVGSVGGLLLEYHLHDLNTS